MFQEKHDFTTSLLRLTKTIGNSLCRELMPGSPGEQFLEHFVLNVIYQQLGGDLTSKAKSEEPAMPAVGS